MPLRRSWVTGPGGHPGCDGTCVNHAFNIESGLLALLDEARRTVAARAGQPDPGPTATPQCPQTARQSREFEQALAQARARSRREEERLLAGGA